MIGANTIFPTLLSAKGTPFYSTCGCQVENHVTTSNVKTIGDTFRGYNLHK